MRDYLFKIVILFLFASFLGACSQEVIVRGHLLRASLLEQVEVGVSNEQDVSRILGTPTAKSSFDESFWYYIGQRREKNGFLPDEIKALEVYVVSFNADGIVQEIIFHDHNELQFLTYNTTRTPTRGSELTIIQQLLGNFGRFSAPTSGGARDLLQR